MKKWPRLSDIFSLQPTVDLETTGQDSSTLANSHWERIKFDNTVRLWIAIPSYVACSVLWMQRAIPSLTPITFIFSTYAVLHFSFSWLLMKSSHGRKIDFLFSTFDLIAMSLAVHFTGGVDSPLYFIYFIPLVVHAFHRDMGVVVYSGFGGVLLYAFAAGVSLTNRTPALLTNLGARLFFMLLTVSIACLALAILRKQDELDRKRIRRLKNLTLASEALNKMTTLGERLETSQILIQLIDEGLGKNPQPMTRFLFSQKEGDQQISSNSLVRQPIPSCPALQDNTPCLMGEIQLDPDCPAENTSFRSHLCLPVSGAENEIFGVLFVGNSAPTPFELEETQFLEFVAKSFGLSIQRLNRMEELRKSLEMNSWVMAATIASTRSEGKTFCTVLDGMEAILKADILELSICDPDSNNRQIVLARGGEVPQERALVFILKNLSGETLGDIRVARLDLQEKFSANEIETAATFSARASLAIENAITHETQRAQIQSFQENPERKRAA